MLIKVRTAHGYLSFQPPANGDPNGAVTVQYRPLPEPSFQTWEEVYVEGLEALVPPPDVPETPPDPELPYEQIPAAIQPVEQSAAYVGRVKAWLESEGHDLSGPCGAFEIVRQVTWYLYLVGSYGVGLLDKPDGNNCEGYATDIVMYSTMGGQIIDILGDGGGQNTPQWGVSDTVDPARWRPPVQPL